MSDLISQARQNALERDDQGWGYRVALEVDEGFEGRYRGSTIASGGDYGDQTLFLFWDRDSQTCYMRGHASLVRKMDGASPQVGDTIAVVRGPDYEGSAGTGYSYGVVSEANDAPLPEGDEDW